MTRLLVITVSVIFLSACTLLRASPARISSFLPQPELLVEKRDRAPFNGYWVRDSALEDQLRASYGKVYLAPINLDAVKAMIAKGPGNEKTMNMRFEEAKELSRYFMERIRLALEARTPVTVLPVPEPTPQALRLELAFSELKPTNPATNALGTVAGFFLYGGGLLKIAGEGSIAMEGVIRNGADNEIIVEFRDREGQKIYPFSLKDYQRYAHIRVALDDWADQIAELLSTPSSHKVEDSDLFSLDVL